MIRSGKKIPISFLAFLLIGLTAWLEPVDQDGLDILFEKGQRAMEAERWSRAVRAWNKVIEMYPEVPDVYYNRGICLRKLEKDSMALLDYNRAIELDSSFVFAYNNRGLVKRFNKDLKGAMNDYNIALQMWPCFATALINRGELNLFIGNYQKAVDDFEKSLGCFDKPSDYQRKALSFDYKGDINTILSFREYYRVRQQVDIRPAAYYNLGYAHHLLRHQEDACFYWLRAYAMGSKSAAVMLMKNCPETAMTLYTKKKKDLQVEDEN